MPADIQLDSGLVPAAVKLGTLAAQHAGASDACRRISPAVMEGMRDAGFNRHLVASRWGGTEGSFDELTRAVLAVGEGCASAAWCASLGAYSARFAAHLPEEGHHALWGSGPDTFVVAGLIPSGKALPDNGGWRLSGRWAYVSGVEFSDWALVCAAVPKDDQPELRFFALPRGAFTIQETWDSIGMRATGSHTLIADDVFVPAHLSFLRSDMIQGRSVSSQVPSHNVPFQAVGGLTFIGPAVAAATGALNAYASLLSGKKRTPVGELQLVRASGGVDSARHLVLQNAAVLDERAFTPLMMARNERNATFAAELILDATALLLRGGGTSGLSESHPLQRFWRDVNSATSHVALQYETAARKTYPAALLGD